MGCGRESVRQASLTHPSGSQGSSQESAERQEGEALGSGLQPRKYREARRGPWQLLRYPVLIPSVGRHTHRYERMRWAFHLLWEQGGRYNRFGGHSKGTDMTERLTSVCCICLPRNILS